MGHVLQIESDEVYAMVSELAGLTGESLEAAVTGALRVRLEAERKRRDVEERVRDILEIAARIRARMGHPLPSWDLSDLYDENGLPI